MGVRTIETRTCEICGQRKDIDWAETKDLREARRGWDRAYLNIHGHTAAMVDLPHIGGVYSKLTCPSEKCVKTAFDEMLKKLNEKLREALLDALAQPVE